MDEVVENGVAKLLEEKVRENRPRLFPILTFASSFKT